MPALPLSITGRLQSVTVAIPELFRYFLLKYYDTYNKKLSLNSGKYDKDHM